MLKTAKKIFVLMPAFGEAKVIGQTITEIKNSGFSNVIVVDDGSPDNTYEEAKTAGAITLRHLINRGKSTAVRTAMEAAKMLDADVAITIDADGQHNPEDAKAMVPYIVEQDYDVVLGSRMANPKGMPWWRILANHCANFFTWLFYGLWVSDSQSGFRAYSQKALRLIKTTATNSHAQDSEIIREIKRLKLKYIEIPIEVRYTKYSMTKAGRQTIRNSLKQVLQMFLNS